MHDSLARALLLHGAVVMLVGFLCGYPFARAILTRRSEDTQRAWRVAHGGLSLIGAIIIVFGLALPQLRAGASLAAVMTWSMVASGYGFAVALPVGAHLGHRGLRPRPPAANRFVYAGNIVGAVGSVLGGALLVVAALGSG